MDDVRELAPHQPPDRTTPPFITTPAGTGAWRDYWLALDERGGHDVRIGAEISSPDEWLHAISNRLGLSLTPQASARFYARPGLAYQPVTGIRPSQVALAWHLDDHRSAVRDFITAALDTIP